jgi:hypothetical protein
MEEARKGNETQALGGSWLSLTSRETAAPRVEVTDVALSAVQKGKEIKLLADPDLNGGYVIEVRYGNAGMAVSGNGRHVFVAVTEGQSKEECCSIKR